MHRDPPPHRRPSRWTALWLAALLASGCRAVDDSAPAPGADAPAATSPDSASVPDGINDRFLSPELDVDEFVGIFEGESREIAVERDAIAEELGLAKGATIVDVGAGTGLFLEPLARAVGPQGKVIAVDISPKFVEHMRSRAQAAGLTQVQPQLCGERSVGLAPSSVDAAFICDTYHHFEHPGEVMASLREAVRPGGLLVVVDFERIPGVTRQWLLDHVRAGKETFRQEIVDAGFEFVTEVEVDGLEENYFLRFRRP